ncbi:Crp/Fnr family transcriptional regulator [Reyranella sp.]|uniref:Crp/Fnr family transcriptional regulator n=1 Tax=Reyranella sp. TaxID=1929291 RepID=UPI003783E080
MTRQELLRLHCFFSGLSAEDEQELLKRTRRRRVPARCILFQEGDAGDGLYGILAGRVAFTVDSSRGKELILNVLGPGDFFGEIALLDGKGRTATAVTRDACCLLFIARSEFMSFLAERPHAMSRIVELLCARLRRSTEWIADATFLDLSTRLAKQLVILAHDEGASRTGTVRVSHAELAGMLGVSRERVSRQLAAWSERGILDQGHGFLVVRNRQALESVIASG